MDLRGKYEVLHARDYGDFADVKTDIFALGSAIYSLMMGHEPFPNLDDLED